MTAGIGTEGSVSGPATKAKTASPIQDALNVVDRALSSHNTVIDGLHDRLAPVSGNASESAKGEEAKDFQGGSDICRAIHALADRVRHQTERLNEISDCLEI